MGAYDALVEVWNGVPWMSPVWCRKPRITFLHHVHGPMWDQLLPRPLAGVGRALEARLAPPFYRRTLTLTPSDATRDDLLRTRLPAGSSDRRQQRRRPDVPTRRRTQPVAAGARASAGSPR